MGASSSSLLRIARDGREEKPYETVKAQKLNEEEAKDRMEICADFPVRIRDGRLRPKKIVFTEEKLFRRGQGGGMSAQNSRV